MRGWGNKHENLNKKIPSSVVAIDPRPESAEISSTSSMTVVGFLSANRSKLMQYCLIEDENLDLDRFDSVYHSLINGDIRTALNASVRTTALLVDILKVNNIRI